MFVNYALNLKIAGEFFNRHAVNNKARKLFHLPLFERLSFYVLFHFSSEILFHLSLTVLTTLSVYKAIFSLTRWSSRIQKGFHVSLPTWDTTLKCTCFRLQDFHLLWYSIQPVSSNKSHSFQLSHNPLILRV